MRTALILSVFGALAVTLAACGDASTSAGTTRRGIPAPGAPVNHDDDDADDTPAAPNPNADSKPTAPTNPGTSTGQLGVTVSNATPAVDLGATLDVTVNVEPKAGFTGDADLSVTGLPTGVTAVFAPAKVTLGAAAVPVKMTITVPMTAVTSAPNESSPVVVTAKSGAVSATANLNFKVNPRLTVVIPMNIDNLRAANVGTRYIDNYGPALGATQAALHTQVGNPIVVVVRNGDTVGHIVHGANGFTHGNTNTPVPPNGVDPTNRSLPQGANANFYMHEGANGPSVSGRILVQP